ESAGRLGSADLARDPALVSCMGERTNVAPERAGGTHESRPQRIHWGYALGQGGLTGRRHFERGHGHACRVPA
ncbi:MAG: hypothetical protein P8Y94_11140, partial [Acidobacteriota bacterium]